MRWYHGWNIIAVCFLFQAVHWGLASYTFTFWVVPWLKEFGADRSDIMLAPAAAIFMMGVLSPVIGWATDRFSIRTFVCAGTILFTIAFALISQATAVWQIVAAYGLLIAAGEAMAGPMVSQILAAKWFRGRRGLALGISSTGISVGGIIFPPVATTLLAAYGWRDAVLFLSFVPILVVLPVAWLVIRNSPADMGLEPEPERISASSAKTSGERSWTTGEILRDRGFQILAIAFIPPNIAIYGIIQNLGPYSHDLGFTAATSSLFMSILSMSMLAGKILFGALADHVRKKYLYWAAMGGLAVALSLFISGIPNFWLMVLNSSIVGFSMGSGMPLMGAIVGSRFGANFVGRVMGLLYPFIALCSIGPVLTGWIRDFTGSYNMAFTAYLFALVPVIILMAFFPEEKNSSKRALAPSETKA